MKTPPHTLVRTFEQMVLFPLDVVIFLNGVVFLLRAKWLLGSFLILIAFLLAMVGQALPHRKRQAIAELRKPEGDERFGDITHAEATGLGQAIVWTTLLVSMVGAAAALYRHLPWYWVMIYLSSSACAFPIFAVAFCLVWSSLMALMAKRRNRSAKDLAS